MVQSFLEHCWSGVSDTGRDSYEVLDSFNLYQNPELKLLVLLPKTLQDAAKG